MTQPIQWPPSLSRPDPDDIVARHGAAGERFVHLLRDGWSKSTGAHVNPLALARSMAIAAGRAADAAALQAARPWRDRGLRRAA